MHYHEFDPPPHLADYVSSYWGMQVSLEGPGPYPHRIVADGCVSIASAGKPNGSHHIAIVGPRIEAFEVPVFSGDRYWGVRFWPDAAGLVLDIPVRSLRDQIVPAHQIMGAGAPSLARALVESPDETAATRAINAVLEPLVGRAAPPDPVVRAAVVGLVSTRGAMPVSDLADEIGISLRQLQRRFGERVGLTPKQFARVRRIRSALGHLLEDEPPSWTTIAAELGYADQAHLIHEVASLAGLTPGALAAKVGAISHGRVRP